MTAQLVGIRSKDLRRGKKGTHFAGIAQNEHIPVFKITSLKRRLNPIIGPDTGRSILVFYDRGIPDFEKVIQPLKRTQGQVILVPLAAGETLKTHSEFYAVLNELGKYTISKSPLMLIVGGGSVCNFSGFVASVWKGMQAIFVPTTTMAMCDVAVGSLQMLNFFNEKNLLRNYYDPSAIIFDFSFVRSLPTLERRNGLSETLKHGLAQDKAILDQLESLIDKSDIFSDKNVFKLALETAEAKNRLLAEDPFGEKTYEILNYGHRVAHAIESASGFSISHGEAVGLGVLVELLAFHSPESTLVKRVLKILRALGLPTRLTSRIPIPLVLEALPKKLYKGKSTVTIAKLLKPGAFEKKASGYLYPVYMEKIRSILSFLENGSI